MVKLLIPWGFDWIDVARAEIHKLERQPAAPLYAPDCYTPYRLGLVSRDFHYKGKGRDAVVRVRLVRPAMVALLRAMRDQPTIQVTGSTYGSYRSCSLQGFLYNAYIEGHGHLAAPPGESYHQTGRSTDLLGDPKLDGYIPGPERRAMLSHGFRDLLPQDPPHFTLGARG